MNYTAPETPLSRSILAGLATGIIGTVVNLIYNFIFRGVTRLSLMISVINVSTIIFATVILCIVGGLLYHFIVYYLKKSSAIYVAIFIILTLLVLIPGFSFQRTSDPAISRQFEGLYIGIIVITGISGAILIPWLVKHKNAFFN